MISKFLNRWVFSTNHKCGTLYIIGVEHSSLQSMEIKFNSHSCLKRGNVL